MDDQTMALNEQAEVETADVATPATEQTVEAESTAEAESKKGYSQRVQELANAKNKAEAEAQSLRRKLEEFTRGIPESAPQFPDTSPLPPLVNPGEEVTIEEINRRQVERDRLLLSRATQISQLQSQQALALERINREAKELTRKYAELDPGSDSFNPELSEVITEAGLAYVRANPGKSLEDFVDKQMKFHKRAVVKEEKAEQAEVNRQHSQSAVRPSTIKPEDKKFGEKSIAEMEAELGFAQ